MDQTEDQTAPVPAAALCSVKLTSSVKSKDATTSNRKPSLLSLPSSLFALRMFIERLVPRVSTSRMWFFMDQTELVNDVTNTYFSYLIQTLNDDGTYLLNCESSALSSFLILSLICVTVTSCDLSPQVWITCRWNAFQVSWWWLFPLQVGEFQLVILPSECRFLSYFCLSFPPEP